MVVLRHVADVLLRARFAWSFALMFMAASCTRATQLMLVIDSDLPASAFDRVLVHVEGGGRSEDYPVDPARRDSHGALTYALVAGNDASADVTITGMAARAGTIIARSGVRTRFVTGSVRVVVLTLCASCPGGDCGVTDILEAPEWMGTAPASRCGRVVTDAGIDGSSDGDARLEDVPGDRTPEPSDAAPDALADTRRDVIADAGPPHEIVRLSGGGSHSCALRRDGRLLCWGLNGSGQLAVPTSITSRASSAEIVVEAGEPVGEVNLGESHSCAVSATTHRAFCWGANGSYQLGIGHNTTPVTLPTHVTVPSAGHWFASISAGQTHTCAVTEDHDLFCWGDNAHGQVIASGTPAMFYPRPTLVPLVDSVTAVATGVGFTCALNTGNRVLCWGDNRLGQLGRGSTTGDRLAPADTRVTAVEQIMAHGNHACLRRAGGEVLCWGENNQAQNTGLVHPTPAPITAYPGAATDVQVGYYFGCARVMSGAVYCFGSNNYGQLGRGGVTDAGVPAADVAVLVTSAGEQWLEVAAGGSHACGRRSDGRVLCWGFNDSGQVGFDTPVSNPRPVVVPGLVASTVP